MAFPRKRNPVAQLIQMMHNTLRPVIHRAVVRKGPAANRIEASVKLLATGGAHRRRGKGVAEKHSLLCKLIDVGCLYVRVAADTTVPPDHIVCYYQ